MGEALKVDIRVNDALREHLALGQQCAVLRDQIVTREHKILRGLTETGICIQVRTQQSAGLLTNKVAAVACLADDLIRSRQVDDNVRAHLRQRSRRPERQNVACVHDSRNVIQLALDAQRQPDSDDSRKLCGLAADRAQRIERSLEQRFLQTQVAAGIAGQAQLGERDKLRAFGSSLLRQLYDLRGIICAVRDVQIRGCRGNFDKSISHR